MEMFPRSKTTKLDTLDRRKLIKTEEKKKSSHMSNECKSLRIWQSPEN